MAETFNYLSLAEWGKSEPSTSRLKGGNDLRQVVADNAEAGRLRVTLNYSPQRVLCILGHGIRLIENHQLQIATSLLLTPCLLALAQTGVKPLGCDEIDDLLPHHLDPTIVRGIQLKHLRTNLLLCEHLPRCSQNCARLPRPGRAIEQQMRESILGDQ